MTLFKKLFKDIFYLVRKSLLNFKVTKTVLNIELNNNNNNKNTLNTLSIFHII